MLPSKKVHFEPCVKGLLLFVCTHKVNKMCFYRIKKTIRMRYHQWAGTQGLGGGGGGGGIHIFLDYYLKLLYGSLGM